MFEMTYPFLEAIDHKISRVAFTNYTIALYSFSLLCVGMCVVGCAYICVGPYSNRKLIITVCSNETLSVLHIIPLNLLLLPPFQLLSLF